MRPTFQDLVHDFHIGIGGQKADADLRIKLISEEAEELLDAIDEEDIISAIDAVCDLLYVIYGTADVYEIQVSERMQTVPYNNPDWAHIRKVIPHFKEALGTALKTIEVFEEFKAKGNLVQSLEGLVDETWAIATSLGVNKLTPFFLEVHRTNMHKLTGPKREDGKQLKPAGWKPPRISAMYDRLQQGASPHCDEDCDVRFLSHYRLESHPEGGSSCIDCGGLVVEVGA